MTVRNFKQCGRVSVPEIKANVNTGPSDTHNARQLIIAIVTGNLL